MRCRGRDGLTGGSSVDLDGIDGTLVNVGDNGIIFNSGDKNVYFYKVDSSGDSEDSPHAIVPDTNGDNKVHKLQGIANYQTHTQALDIINAVESTASTAVLATTTFGNTKIKTRAFDKTTAEYMYMLWNALNDINTKDADLQVRLKFAFSGASLSSNGVAFTVQAHQPAEGAALGGTWGTTATIVKTGLTTSGALYTTDWTSLSVASINANSPISLKVGRYPTHASDDANGDALVFGVEVKYTRLKMW
jgi:hypothetical protein